MTRFENEAFVEKISVSDTGFLSFAVGGVTIRECASCHALTAGGPSICARCAEKTASVKTGTLSESESGIVTFASDGISVSTMREPVQTPPQEKAK